jgi:tetratricopeptide (TPR) repeat protein
MDLSFLGNEMTFGMNRIYLMFDKWNFRPTYYVSVNPLVLEQSAAEILKIKAAKFLSHKGIAFFPHPPDDLMFIRSIPKWVFSTDPRNGLCEGWTVTYFTMQLAYYMGFEEVVLIGVDHHFTTQGDPNKEVVSEGDDPNHFHPGYFGKGVRWHLPDLERSEKSYRMAKQAFEAEGRRILDATVDGRLTVFPKVDYRRHFAPCAAAASSVPHPHGSTANECLREARSLLDAGNPAEALAVLGKAVRWFPAEASLHYAAGVMSVQCGDRQAAVPFLEAAVKLDPNNTTYLNELAWCYHEGLGRSADALDLLKKALQAGCGRQETCRSISRILYSVGQPENARHFEGMAAGLPMPGI